MKRSKRFDFDVALSFADEDRSYVNEVATYLSKMDYRVFYDLHSLISSWGKDLYSYLDEIYRKKARYSVVFISKHYKKKLWTNHERKSAQARAFKENYEYILPVRFDNTEIPGILPTTVYIDGKSKSPKKLAEMIKQKIGYIPRELFFPTNINRLYKILNARNEDIKNLIDYLTHLFFKSLTLMSKNERQLLTIIFFNSCSAGEPNNFHLNLDLLQRLTNLTKNQIIAIFQRLDCLDYKCKIYVRKKLHTQKEALCQFQENIEIKYQPNFVLPKNKKIKSINNSTFIIWGILECMKNNLCQNCELNIFTLVNFAILSDLSFSEKRR